MVLVLVEKKLIEAQQLQLQVTWSYNGQTVHKENFGLALGATYIEKTITKHTKNIEQSLNLYL